MTCSTRSQGREGSCTSLTSHLSSLIPPPTPIPHPSLFVPSPGPPSLILFRRLCPPLPLTRDPPCPALQPRPVYDFIYMYVYISLAPPVSMPSLLNPSTPHEYTQSSQELDALAARAFWTSSFSSSSSSSSRPCRRRFVCIWCLSLPPPHLHTSRHVCSAAPRPPRLPYSSCATSPRTITSTNSAWTPACTSPARRWTEKGRRHAPRDRTRGTLCSRAHVPSAIDDPVDSGASWATHTQGVTFQDRKHTSTHQPPPPPRDPRRGWPWLEIMEPGHDAID